MLPTNVLDSSESLTLSFQSWEDPGFLGHPRILPSCPSHTAAHAVSEDSLDIQGSSLGVPSDAGFPSCPEDPLDIPGFSLGIPSDTGPHAVQRIPWTFRDPPLGSHQTQAPMLSGGSRGHPRILPWDPITYHSCLYGCLMH